MRSDHRSRCSCALRAPTVLCVRIEGIRTQSTVMVKSNNGMGLCLYKIGDSARMAFIRAESAIRADGTPSAQYRVCGRIIAAGALARYRAPTVLLVRIEGIRTQSTVMVKSNNRMGLCLYKIGDSARMAFIRAESAIRADGTPAAQ